MVYVFTGEITLTVTHYGFVRVELVELVELVAMVFSAGSPPRDRWTF